MSTDTLLSVQGLTKQFQTRSGTVKAVDGVSFDVKRGTIVGLVGESGSGKTTAGRCTLRLVEPNEGRIVFDGVDLRTLSERDMRAYRSRLQIIFQDPYSSLNPRLRIDQIIGEALDIHRSGQRQRPARPHRGTARESGPQSGCGAPLSRMNSPADSASASGSRGLSLWNPISSWRTSPSRRSTSRCRPRFST